jgi:hypothetical protein
LEIIMPDALKETRQAVCYIDDRAHLELLADEFIFPITTRDERFKLRFHMRPYQPHEVKRFYDEMIPRRKRRTAQQMTVETPDYTEANAFVLDHFICMDGVTLPDGSDPTVEQQRTWLEENPDFLTRIFREGYDTVGTRDEPEEPTAAKAVLVFGRQDYRIPSEFTLYSPERCTDETVRVGHVLSRLTQADRHQYDRAVKVIENARRREVHTEANWDVVEGIYDSRIRSLEGALYDGHPCTETSKAEWRKVVPFCMKVYVTAQAFVEVELGNG